MPDIVDTAFMQTVFILVLSLIGISCVAALIFGVTTRRFSDKLVVVNLVTTLSMNAICILAVWLKQDYVLDIALIYALLSFVAVVVLCRLMTGKGRGKGEDR